MSNDILNNFSPFMEEHSETDDRVGRYYGDIYDLANAFLSISAMTHKKLQKLCYYAKAWYLAINDDNLISENFEAWVHGAVQPELYAKYRAYGFQLISMYNGEMSSIPEEFLDFSREVFEAYGALSGDDLEKINHQETPWINARKGLKPWESCTEIISEEDMKQYYRKLMS